MATRRRFRGFGAYGGDPSETILFMSLFAPKLLEQMQSDARTEETKQAEAQLARELKAEKELGEFDVGLKERAQRTADFDTGTLLTKELARQKSEQLKALPGYQSGLSLGQTPTGGGLPADFANYPGANWGVEETGRFSRLAPQIATSEQVRNQLPFMAAEANRREERLKSEHGLALDTNLLTRQNLGVNEQLNQEMKRGNIFGQYFKDGVLFNPNKWGEPSSIVDQGRFMQEKVEPGVNTKTKEMTPGRTIIRSFPTNVRRMTGDRMPLGTADELEGANNPPVTPPPVHPPGPVNPKTVPPEDTLVNQTGKQIGRSLFKGSINNLLTKGQNSIMDYIYGQAAGLDETLKYLKPKGKRVLDIIKDEAGMY